MVKRISRFPDYGVDELGVVYSFRRRKIRALARGLDSDGYERVAVISTDGKHFTVKVHRLVLETFIGPCPRGMETCHGPLGKTNNTLSNLSWGTPKKNQGEDRPRDGTSPRGEKNGGAKLNHLQVRIMRRAYAYYGKCGLTGKELASIFHIHQTQVSRIVRGGGWNLI